MELLLFLLLPLALKFEFFGWFLLPLGIFLDLWYLRPLGISGIKWLAILSIFWLFFSRAEKNKLRLRL